MPGDRAFNHIQADPRRSHMPVLMPSANAPAAGSAPHTTPRGHRHVDPIGAGAFLLAMLGFIAVVMLLRPAATPTTTSAPVNSARSIVSVEPHHPVDKHDEANQSFGAWTLPAPSAPIADVHHPVDKHDQP
jgi:hypothetical protein